MKALKIVKKVLFGILAFVYFAFALCMTVLLLNYNDYNVTQFGDTSLVIMNSKISRDEFKKGQLVLVDAVKLENIKEGDLIFTYKLDEYNIAHIEIGNVGDVYPDDNAITFENGDSYTYEFIIGKATKTYDNVGTFLSIVESKWGFLFIVLVPCFLIFIYELYALIVEIKYGDEEIIEEETKKKKKDENKEVDLEDELFEETETKKIIKKEESKKIKEVKNKKKTDDKDIKQSKNKKKTDGDENEN